MDQTSEDQPAVVVDRHEVNDEDAGDEGQAVLTRVEKRPEPTKEEQERDKIPDQLPVLPIRNIVAFPGTVMPLTVGRPKSKALLDSVLTGNKTIAAVAQRFAETEDPLLFDLYRVGTACRILKLLHMPDGSESIVVHGVSRIGVVDLTQTEPFLVAKVQTHEDLIGSTTELDALVHSVRQTALRIIELAPNIPDEAALAVNNIESPGGLADFLASNLQLDLAKKQELLETFDVVSRLKKVHGALMGQLEILELSQRIQERVRGEVDKTQRRYFLQEQLKAIQSELGESDARTADIERLRERVQEAKMPEAVEKEANRELERLEMIPQASPEYSVSHDYVTWLADLPWSKGTKESLSVLKAEETLNADHYGLEKVKKRILEFLAVRKLRPTGRGPILCFAGPPGVGKTSLGQSIARALNRKFIRISLGGIRDEADIRGHRRTYIGAIPGRIIQEIRKAESNNPVFMLDEVDKVGADFRGDPSAALLEVLDPEQNHSFTDHYLDVPFDLSKVFFIATANYMDPIPPALCDRMEIIDIPGYTDAEKAEIARRYLVPRQTEENGLKGRRFQITDDALGRIISSYTREAGVRQLEREIAAICRGVAAKIARGDVKSAEIDADHVHEYLGPIEYQSEVAMRTSVPGVVTGLAYTPVGGDLIFVEATRMPGRGSLTLTGQLGDVMRESAAAAFSIVRSRSAELGVDADELANTDVHVHVPAGAIPKDGPSAGVAIFTALVSLLTGRPTRPDVAMTGEITLRGLVLPVGGLKAKLLAAHRAGIKRVVLPSRNEKDLVEIPASAREELQFVFVERVDDALKAAFGEVPRKRAARAKKRTSRATQRASKKRAKKTRKKTSRRARKRTKRKTRRRAERTKKTVRNRRARPARQPSSRVRRAAKRVG